MADIQPTNQALTDSQDPSVEIIRSTREAAAAWGRAHGKVGKGNQNPGANAYMGPSSLTPGQKADPAAVDANKAKAVPADDWQTREVSAEPYPAAHGLRSQQDMKAALSAKLPDKLGAAAADDSAARRAQRS